MATKKKSAGVSTYWIGGGVAVVALSAAAAGYMLVGGSSDRAAAIPKDMSVAALKVQAETDPGKMMEKMRETMRRDDLTDEQRREIGANMRQVWQSMMTDRVNEWYEAQTDDEKVAILDRQIDEFMNRMNQWQERQAEREREGEDNAEERERMRQMWANPTREERKARSESRNPDQMARTMVYFAAVRARMDQRGIQMPQGRGMGGRGAGRRGP